VFHIDEAMSWETVRHLERMEPLVLLIRNLAVQGNAPGEVIEDIDEVTDLLKEVYQTFKQSGPR
jgi:endonuclease IV